MKAGSAFGRSLGALARGGRALRVRGLGRLGGLVDHGLERQLAAVVDLGDADQDLAADGQDVLDVLDTLATRELADLADVQQAVLAGAGRDERT
ncbi:hypothetical protein SRABI128_02700 [Microbacterium sp. Bi128]|nr:hypothetical protein SRABI128_02700 [Microbacterium sp. Bi128]